jgi:hypothetical protein
MSSIRLNVLARSRQFVNARSLASILVAVSSFHFCLRAQTVSTEQQPRMKWSATWISHPTAPLRDPVVLHFRKVIHLASRPAQFKVLVSADNRFVLYVNGQRAGEGPARGDFLHWRYETFDLAPLLRDGENVIAATVWQFGVYAPLAQISDRAAFLLQGDTSTEAVADTNSSWQVEQESGQLPQRPLPQGMWEYWAAGPGERLDGSLYDWDWKGGGDSAASHWVSAAPAIRESIYPSGSTPAARTEDTGQRWLLEPDALPPMEYTEVPTGKVVRTDLEAAQEFPGAPVTVPPNSDITILVDEGVVLTAYPELTVSGGKGAKIEMMYTEALYDSRHRRTDRSAIESRVVNGLTDDYIADGGTKRTFTSLWWRTWRFVQLHIQTASEPLQLQSFRTYYTAYPFQERGQFASSDPELEKIREICWRTARLDAHETYMDSAYWEQLQYVGDTRLQALISYVVSGDDRLARQALRAFDGSRVPEGITLSRYPTSLPQFIPPFSLLYVSMLHDYWMYRPDKAFVKELLPGTRTVLDWFIARQREDGFLEKLPWWGFVDSPQGVKNFPPHDGEGRSAVITLQFIGALRDAAELEAALGDEARSARYRQRAESASNAVYERCWDASRGLLADTPEKNSFSEHANLLAVLFDVIPRNSQSAVMGKVLASHASSEPKLAPVSLFFQFYLARAADHANLGDRYLELLEPWREMLAKHLTTTPEYPDPSRSDTHAWSAHPAYDLTTLVAGIAPDAPGFARVRIAPHLGTLSWVIASLPAPAGLIETSYRVAENRLDAIITLPSGLDGVFVWKGKEYPVKSGRQEFHLAL